MKGFFSGEEIIHRVSKTRGNKEKLNTSKSIDPCDQCRLYEGCVSPKMEFTGQGRKKILIIAEAPGKTEDEQGTQLVGDAGKLFRECLNSLDCSLDRDFWKTNIINCRPPNNRKPSRREMKFCYSRLSKTIDLLKPDFIWLMGGSALEGFFIDNISDLNILAYRKRYIPYPKYNCWVIPLFHPSFILRQGNKEAKDFFTRDLKWALSCLSLTKPVEFNPTKFVKVLTNIDDVKNILKKIKENKLVAFDYETSSLNPYKNNQKIWSIGVACSSEEAFSFGFDHPEVVEIQRMIIRRLWSEILIDPEVKKIAQNLKFEDKWSRQIFKVVPQGWLSDTMTSQHILDDRRGTTGLKFQSFVRWGVQDYTDSINKFISSGSDNSNKLDQVSIKDLCIYNGSDALLTFKLYEEQKKEFQRLPGLRKADALFFEGILAFCDVEEEGIRVDTSYFSKEEKALTKQIEKLTSELSNSKEAKLYQEKTGRILSLNSSKDLRELFYKILGCSSPKTTNSGVESVDFASLTQLKSPFATTLIKLRKLLKIRDTYLGQFKREENNGKIHPSFNLHIAESYRSSSQNPNFQNIPTRDEDAKRTIRRGILPSPGNKLAEVDYSSIEVRLAAVYTHDPKLIEYIHDPSTDMHRDQACDLFKLRNNQVSKDIRFYAKNGFVFPQFYGSTYQACSANLWNEVKNLKTVQGTNLLEHLQKKQITNYYKFQDHVQSVSEAFWKKFYVFKEWQEDIVEFYNRKGYVEMIFGHRRGGFLSKNQIINSPIQGGAFHCLLWSLIEINKLRKKENWKTKLIGQIHDSIVFDLYPSEEEHVITTVKRIMCEDLRKAVPEIIVPLEVETDITPIDGSWYTKTKRED